jgi:hypothetical protein
MKRLRLVGSRSDGPTVGGSDWSSQLPLTAQPSIHFKEEP